MENREEKFVTINCDEKVIRTIVRTVQMCGRYVPSATCLTQALAARRLLKSEGQFADLKIGVAKDGSIFQAHAWLELEGRIILGKLPSHSRYSVLT